MLLLTCFPGTVGVLTNELKKLGYIPRNTFDTGTFVDRSDFDAIYDLNLRSRIANKVYLQLGSGQARTFDELFAFIKTFYRSDYLQSGQELSIKVISKYSSLYAPRAIQSIAHKAILTKMSEQPKKGVQSGQRQLGILVKIEHNNVSVRVNTSGVSLHNRGYRTQQGQAPLKETIAAALVQLSGWRFKFPLIDPCCGSGTMVIEAAMIARNIAPGLHRAFAFQGFQKYDNTLFLQKKSDLQLQTYEGVYDIAGYDRDPTMIVLAQANAKRAGVDDIVRFELQDATNLSPVENGYLVTNPPYGSRLSADEQLDTLYQSLVSLYQSGLKGCMISSREGKALDHHIFDHVKDLNNNGEKCKVYVKR